MSVKNKTIKIVSLKKSIYNFCNSIRKRTKFGKRSIFCDTILRFQIYTDTILKKKNTSIFVFNRKYKKKTIVKKARQRNFLCKSLQFNPIFSIYFCSFLSSLGELFMQMYANVALCKKEGRVLLVCENGRLNYTLLAPLISLVI